MIDHRAVFAELPSFSYEASQTWHYHESWGRSTSQSNDWSHYGSCLMSLWSYLLHCVTVLWRPLICLLYDLQACHKGRAGRKDPHLLMLRPYHLAFHCWIFSRMIVVAYPSSAPPPLSYDYSYWLTRGVSLPPLLVRLCRLRHQTGLASLLASQPSALDSARLHSWGWSCWEHSLKWILKLSVRSCVWGRC